MRWLITILVLLNAGWMVFDGMRALLVGDYLTPKSGRTACFADGAHKNLGRC